MKVTVENGKVSVESAYNKDWIARARELGGKWNAPAWVFPEANEELVRDALLSIYGENGRPVKKVTIDINLDSEGYYGQDYQIAGITVLRRRGRDYAVSCENGCVIVSGGFEKSGGSAANPRIGTPDKNTVIRVSIPEAMLGRVKEQYTIHEGKVNKAALEAEKAELLKRLAEIETLLAI